MCVGVGVCVGVDGLGLDFIVNVWGGCVSEKREGGLCGMDSYIYE